jgi:hypothetical protein
MSSFVSIFRQAKSSGSSENIRINSFRLNKRLTKKYSLRLSSITPKKCSCVFTLLRRLCTLLVIKLNILISRPHPNLFVSCPTDPITLFYRCFCCRSICTVILVKNCPTLNRLPGSSYCSDKSTAVATTNHFLAMFDCETIVDSKLSNTNRVSPGHF